MSVLKQVVKIILNNRYVEHHEIGLYTPSDASRMSELRWCKSPVFNTEESYLPHIIKSVSPISQKANLMRFGGGVMSDTSFDVTVYNNDQLSLKLEELNIKLQGKDIEIYEFKGTDADSDSISTKRRATGMISNTYEWDDKVIQLKATSSRKKKRANLSYVINKNNRPYVPGSNENKILPVTFGQSDPANGRFFKMICDRNKKDQLLNKDIVNPESTYYPVKFGLFPITEYSFGENIYTFRIGSSNMSVDASNLVGKYIKCVEGDSTNKDVYRKILSAQEVGITPPTDERLIQITLESYLPVDMVGNWDGTEENQAWIEIYDLEKEYSADSGACGGFFDSETGEPIPDSKAEVYTEGEDGQIIRIPPQSLEVTTIDNNRIKSNPLHFSNNPDNVNTYHTIPVESFGLQTDDDLGAYSTAEVNMSIYKKRIDGVYSDPDYVPVTDIELVTAYNNENNVYDRKHDTFAYWKFRIKHADGEFGHGIGNLQKAFKITLPEIPDNMTFTKAYLGLKLWSKCIHVYDPQNVYIKKRGYINRASDVLGDKKLDEAGDGAFIDNIPDFYYSPEPDTKNKNFFRTEEPESSGLYKTISNHTFFELCETVSEYRAIEELLLFINRYRVFDPSVWTDDETKIYQACVIFETTAQIKDVVYV